MATTTEDLQRQAWRELYEMLSASLEPGANEEEESLEVAGDAR